MGCWSATIMGGDTPMDFRCAQYDIIGLDEFDEDVTPKQLRDAINKNLTKLTTWAMSEENHSAEDDYRNVAFQSLGVLIIENGARLPAKLRAHILKAAREDGWANAKSADVATESYPGEAVRFNEGIAERKKYVDHFIKQVESYPAAGGRRRKVAYEGLFDKLAQRINS